jgi:hypothetical protein
VDPQATIEWLLAGDPSVAWQAERDLLGLPESVWGPKRARVAREGWGKRLLDLQESDGKWAGGLYTPKWTSTNYTLLQLRHLGLEPSNGAAVTGGHVLLDQARWVDGGVTYWTTHDTPERCVNGMALSIASYFEVDDPRADDIAAMLLRSQVGDGGWNCRDYLGDTEHSSFHTTISVLEGLLLWKRRTGSNAADEAIAAGQEVLLAHRMYRSHTTGDIINEAWTRFSFPPRWHYDILRGLDHLQDAGVAPDGRAFEAVDVVRSRRRSDGGWPVGPRYTGERHFTMEEGRKPGRWNTLRALRVLRWWESA